MESPAFAATAPVLTHSTAPVSATSIRSTPQRVSAARPVVRRARLAMTMQDEDRSIPQGFTAFSENLNGRAAMMGFVLAVVTEAITGQGIVGQVGSLAKIFEVSSPFN